MNINHMQVFETTLATRSDGAELPLGNASADTKP
jgi:hypothetical protein